MRPPLLSSQSPLYRIISLSHCHNQRRTCHLLIICCLLISQKSRLPTLYFSTMDKSAAKKATKKTKSSNRSTTQRSSRNRTPPNSNPRIPISEDAARSQEKRTKMPAKRPHSQILSQCIRCEEPATEFRPDRCLEIIEEALAIIGMPEEEDNDQSPWLVLSTPTRNSSGHNSHSPRE